MNKVQRADHRREQSQERGRYHPFADRAEKGFGRGGKTVTETLSDVYTKSMESGCDVYGVQQSLYRHNYKYYEKMKDDICRRCIPSTASNSILFADFTRLSQIHKNGNFFS